MLVHLAQPCMKLFHCAVSEVQSHWQRADGAGDRDTPADLCVCVCVRAKNDSWLWQSSLALVLTCPEPVLEYDGFLTGKH